MDRASVERLRHDRRLKNRDGWVEPESEEAYLAALPDVAEKMTTCAAEEDAAEAAAEEASAQRQPELEPTAPAPVAGDFSASPSFSSTGAPPSSNPPAPPAPEPSSPPLPDQGSAGTFRSERGFGEDSNSN